MGWKDGTPLNQQPQQDAAPPQQPQQPAPSQSGWRSGQSLNQPATTPPPADTSGQNASSPSFTDMLMAHLAGAINTASDLTGRTFAETRAPWSQIGHDVASTFREGQWLGLDQPALAAARGVSTDEQRRQDADAYSRLGFFGMPVTGAGFAAGGGALGVGKALASEAFAPLANYMRPTIARYISGVLGSAGEGGAANYLSSLFHGGSLADAGNAFWQSLPWSVLGGVTGGSQADPYATIKSPVADLTAQERTAYQDLPNILYHGADTTKAVQDVTNAIVAKEGQGPLDLAKSTNAQIDWLLEQPASTAADIQSLQQRLDDISGNPSAAKEDRRFARQYSDGLDWLHENAQPIAGGNPGDAADILDAGAPITQARKNAQMMDKWARQADITGNPTYPATAARSELLDNPQFYAGRDPTQPGGYNVNDPRTQALQDLANTAPGGGTPGYQAVKHGIGPLGHAAAGEVLGQSIGYPMAGSAAGLGLYAGLLPLYSKLADTIQSGATRRRYEQAYPTMTGGEPAPLAAPKEQTPIEQAFNLRQQIRNIIYGYTAAGQPLYSSNQPNNQ
jgi:hypothetical protein